MIINNASVLKLNWQTSMLFCRYPIPILLYQDHALFCSSLSIYNGYWTTVKNNTCENKMSGIASDIANWRTRWTGFVVICNCL